MKLRRLTPREKWCLLLLVLTAFSVAAVGGRIHRQVLLRGLLRADAPAGNVFFEAIDQSADPAGLLERFWATGKIPQRLAVLEYARMRGSSDSMLLTKLGSVLFEAIQDGDYEAKEMAFRIWAGRKPPGLALMARAQIYDSDPAVRLLGLEYLRRSPDSGLVPVIVPLLDDPDPSVVASAGNLLQKWTGQDFGIRLAQAVPQFSHSQIAEPQPGQIAALHRGVQLLKAWWTLHQSDYPTETSATLQPPGPIRFAISDFALEDFNGKKARLSEFRGRPVLLCFWDQSVPSCQNLITNLIELQRRRANRLAVLAVSLETTSSERSCEAEHEHEHGKGHAAHGSVDLVAVRSMLRSFSAEKGLNFPLLIDPDGRVAHRFQAEQLPTTILIDDQGRFRRRFIGARTVGALQAMLNEMHRD